VNQTVSNYTGVGVRHFILDFRHVVVFRNDGDSNETVVENYGQISHFLTPVIFRGSGGRKV